ncbi:hypothetical protein [Oryza sativa Japonica Group]|uniref:Uncharacterized protein n=1 Tax=Oryza sativa subsp. japonica TaxID=39947 RepID=Q5ZBS5_ORYSJ|nr:hypothetical protein [Oryza sativa Japonica Group]
MEHVPLLRDAALSAPRQLFMGSRSQAMCWGASGARGHGYPRPRRWEEDDGVPSVSEDTLEVAYIVDALRPFTVGRNLVYVARGFVYVAKKVGGARSSTRFFTSYLSNEFLTALQAKRQEHGSEPTSLYWLLYAILLNPGPLDKRQEHGSAPTSLSWLLYAILLNPDPLDTIWKATRTAGRDVKWERRDNNDLDPVGAARSTPPAPPATGIIRHQGKEKHNGTSAGVAGQSLASTPRISTWRRAVREACLFRPVPSPHPSFSTAYKRIGIRPDGYAPASCVAG